MKKQYRDFESAREFVRELGLKNREEWFEYCKSGNKPDDIPFNPYRTYKNEFKGYGDWIGTDRIATKKLEYLSFKEAREFVRSLGLMDQKEWMEYRQSGNKPNNIPTNPDRTYKNEWKGSGDFLGTGNVASRNRIFLPFKEAREFVIALNLKGSKEWQDYCRSGNKPDDIPYGPETVYKNKGWDGYQNFLGNEWCSFTEAREFVRKLKLKNHKEWIEYCKSGDKPDDIPSAPWFVYKEWKNK